MKLQFSVIAPALVFMLLGFAVGCNRSNDNEITSEVQQRINADSGLRNKQIAVVAASVW